MIYVGVSYAALSISDETKKKPDNISWLQGILGLMADNQKIIKKNTYVFGKMVYIWQDFEKGLDKKYRVSQNGIDKG
jgi:hypothetical protein